MTRYKPFAHSGSSTAGRRGGPIKSNVINAVIEVDCEEQTTLFFSFLVAQHPLIGREFMCPENSWLIGVICSINVSAQQSLSFADYKISPIRE